MILEETLNTNTNTVIDETPSKNQTKKGILLGLGYLTIFTVILYYPLFYIILPSTEATNDLLSTICQLIVAVVTSGVMMWICRDRIFHIKDGFKFKHILKCLGFAVLCYLMVIWLGMIDTMLDPILGTSETNTNQSSINYLYQNYPGLAVLFTCVIAPIIEELIFRYFIFKPIAKTNVKLAYIVSCGSFGIIHISSALLTCLISALAGEFEAATLINELRSVFTYIGCAAVFCFEYHKTKHLIYPLLSHSFYNLIATILTFVSMAVYPSCIRVSDIQTHSTSFSFCIEVNEVYIDTYELEGVEIYYVNGDESETTVASYSKNDGYNGNINYVDGLYTIEELEPGNIYYIRVKYNYFETSDASEATKEEIETYVYTFEK